MDSRTEPYYSAREHGWPYMDKLWECPSSFATAGATQPPSGAEDLYASLPASRSTLAHRGGNWRKCLDWLMHVGAVDIELPSKNSEPDTTSKTCYQRTVSDDEFRTDPRYGPDMFHHLMKVCPLSEVVTENDITDRLCAFYQRNRRVHRDWDLLWWRNYMQTMVKRGWFVVSRL
jgi:hypothetical protein